MVTLFQGALCPSFILIVNIFSLYTLWNKNKKKFADLKKEVDF